MGIDPSMTPMTQMLQQLSFVAAVLAGFAVTFVVGLLAGPHNGRHVDRTIVAACVAAALLVVSTIVSVTGVMYIQDRPNIQASGGHTGAVMEAFKWAGVSFMFGMVALLLTVGLSGWIRSRTVGKATTVISVCTYLLLSYYLRVVLKFL